jgi:hypothetical protein
MKPNFVEDYNPHQYSFEIAKQEGVVIGREQMKIEVLAILHSMALTKPMSRVIELVRELDVEK